MGRKRKPGRPKGSKNKVGHKAGRPKGSTKLFSAKKRHAAGHQGNTGRKLIVLKGYI